VPVGADDDVEGRAADDEHVDEGRDGLGEHLGHVRRR